MTSWLASDSDVCIIFTYSHIHNRDCKNQSRRIFRKPSATSPPQLTLILLRLGSIRYSRTLVEPSYLSFRLRTLLLMLFTFYSPFEEKTIYPLAIRVSKLPLLKTEVVTS
jgi:hypothetical protein